MPSGGTRRERKRARDDLEQEREDEERELRRLERGCDPAAINLGHGPPVSRAIGVVLILLVAVISSAVSVAVLQRLKANDPRREDRQRARMDFQSFQAEMTEREFQRYYRIPRSRSSSDDASPSPRCFKDLVQAIKPEPHALTRQERSVRATHGDFISYELRVSMALRYLAGGSYLDIMYLHGVSKSTFFTHLWPTLRAIEAACPAFSLDDDIHDLERCRELSAAFARKTDGHILGAIAAVDGIIFKVEKPSSSITEKCPNPNKFHCRKGFPGIAFQMACDADRRISLCTCDFAASVHDSRAFRMAKTRRGTRLSHEIASSTVLPQTGLGHPHGFFLLADDAYKASDTMVVPWTNVKGQPFKDSFNHQQSRGRINIECTFGMLVKKFLVLGRPMLMDIDKAILTVHAAAKLHNLCIDCRLPASTASEVHVSDFTGRRDPVAAHMDGTDGIAGRGSADFARHLSSGTVNAETGQPTCESPLTAWDEDDVPNDLVPNRTDLIGGPRQALTEALGARGILRPDPKLLAARMAAVRQAH